MRHLILLLASAFLFAGCASAPKRSQTEPGTERPEIAQRLADIFDAAEKKDLERLDSYHLYGPKFTKFSPESADRLGAEAARKGEHDGLAPVRDLKMRAEQLKIDQFGNAAVATFILHYSFKMQNGSDFDKRTQGTLVLVKDGGEWKITHEHFSAMP